MTPAGASPSRWGARARSPSPTYLRVAQTLFKMAVSGEHPAATIYYLNSRGGWKDHPRFQSAAAPPPFIVASDKGGTPE